MQRHLAAIMALDAVGFSRLVGEDEERTLAELERLRSEAIVPAIAVHRGRVFKTTGDGLLAEFASVVDAVRGAVELQARVADATREPDPAHRIVFRIGVHVGDVVADGDDLLGDGVNLAVRLEQLAEPGGVALSSSAREQVRDRLPGFAFRDGGEAALKNIARPVRVWHATPPTGWQRPPAGREDAVSKPATPASDGATTDDRPSLAVLPFKNMSGDRDQDYFADAITEELVVAASRFRGLLVIAGTASAAFRDAPTDVRSIAAKLRARYLLHGTVQRAGDRIRVTAQLVDSASGERVWADRYDALLSDVFAVQDEITGRIVAAVAPHIGDAEVAAARVPGRVFAGSYDLALRAQALATDAREREDLDGVREAIALARQATQIEPVSPRAYEVLAQAWMRFVEIDNKPEETAPAHREAQSAAERARAMSPLGHTAHALLGHIAILSRRAEDAHRCLRRALELNPNDPSVAVLLSWAESNDGNGEAAVRLAQDALRRTPTGSARGRALWSLALAHWVSGDLEASLARGKEAVAEKPGVAGYRGVVVASLAELGRMDEARSALADAETLSADYVRSRLAGKSWFTKQALAERYAVALRKAAGR